MRKKISIGIIGVDFEYDDITFEKFINAFPQYEILHNDVFIHIVYKSGCTTSELIECDECNIDIDPVVIKGYRALPTGDVIYLHSGLILERNFLEKRLVIINQKFSLECDISGFIETFIANVLYNFGCIAIHGAALVYEGDGVAILGKSGSGKSTTMIQLLEQATGILANDFFCLDLSNSEMWSLDRTIGVRKSNSLYVQDQLEKWDINSKIHEFEQSYYDLERLEKLNYIKRAQLKKIVFCNVGNNKHGYILKKIMGIELFQCILENFIHLSPRYNKVNYYELFRVLEQKFEFYKLELPNFQMSLIIEDNIFNNDFLRKLIAGE